MVCRYANFTSFFAMEFSIAMVDEQDRIYVSRYVGGDHSNASGSAFTCREVIVKATAVQWRETDWVLVEMVLE